MIHYLYPGGKKFALTFSYDDGAESDRRLSDLFSENGMKGTFNLCGSWLDKNGRLRSDELKSLFIDRGHEVACHGFEHPFEEKLPPAEVMEDIRKDRLFLEQATDGMVRGFAYPFGTFNDTVKDVLRTMGICYARTVHALNDVRQTPEDFLEWNPTCHHNGDITGHMEAMLHECTPFCDLLYIWGHSTEFNGAKNWDKIETFCRTYGNNDQIWYATNLEIFDYLQAYRRLIFSMDKKKVQNPGVIPVWLRAEGNVFEVKPGATVEIG